MANLTALRGIFKQSENNIIFDADQDSSDVRKDNAILFNKLFIEDSGYKLVSSSPKVFSAIHKSDFTENFYISEEELNSYITGFISSVNNNISEVITTAVESGAEDDLNKAALDDSDVKLSFYRSFKSLYDKWISKSTTESVSGGTTSGYFFNNYGTDTDGRMLFDHFSFITRGGSDIGHKAVIDVAYLSNLTNKDTGQGSTQSLYQSLTELLGKNNFDFFALPSLIQYSSSDESVLKDIFRAFDGPLNPEPAKPGFVCLFVGGSSRSLDIPQSYCGNKGIGFEYTNDSFDINDPSSYPEDIINNGGITAFLIKYGQQSQNHFYSLQLDQAEFKETQESLLVIDALVNPKTGSQPSQAGKGNNIYDNYLTRSYSCTVETLGNMMLQPLMYFKLDNIPMFRGTYIIKNVTHEIKPHNVKTTFIGVRQPIVTVPVVTDAISLLDLSLIDANETAGTGGGTSNSNISSGYNSDSSVSPTVGATREDMKVDKLQPGFDTSFKKIITNGTYAGITISDYQNDWLAVTSNYIGRKETFTAKAANDEGTLRAGYGTDKILLNGSLQKVTSSTVFTREVAKNTLVYQVKNTYAKQIEKDLGSSNWNKLNKFQKAALVSLGYNAGAYYISAREYGQQIKQAIQNGDFKEAAQGILNGPITGAQSGVLQGLINRRIEEARLFLLDPNFTITYIEDK